MKTCFKCKQEKTRESFHKNACRKDGLNTQCKDCYKKYNLINSDKIKQYQKSYRQKNTLKMKEYNKEYSKEYRKLNLNKIKEKNREYYKSNIDKYKKNSKKWHETNKSKVNAKFKIRVNCDPLFKLRKNVRALIHHSFKRNKTKNFKKQLKTEQLLGCTIAELYNYLASKFTEGMTFENHGQWHIDHVIPLASATSQSEIEKLCHYTNLQPLWAKDNLSKGANINST